MATQPALYTLWEAPCLLLELNPGVEESLQSSNRRKIYPWLVRLAEAVHRREYKSEKLPRDVIARASWVAPNILSALVWVDTEKTSPLWDHATRERVATRGIRHSVLARYGKFHGLPGLRRAPAGPRPEIARWAEKNKPYKPAIQEAHRLWDENSPRHHIQMLNHLMDRHEGLDRDRLKRMLAQEARERDETWRVFGTKEERERHA